MDKIDLILQESEKAYQQDRTRAKSLGKAAEKLIGAVAVIMGFHLIEIERLSLFGAWQPAIHGWFSIIALLALGSSLCLSLISMQTWKYYAYPRGTTLIDELKDDSVSDEGAKIKVSCMYLEAHDINAGINDKRARLVFASGLVLVSGLVLIVIGYVVGKVIL